MDKIMIVQHLTRYVFIMAHYITLFEQNDNKKWQWQFRDAVYLLYVSKERIQKEGNTSTPTTIVRDTLFTMMRSALKQVAKGGRQYVSSPAKPDMLQQLYVDTLKKVKPATSTIADAPAGIEQLKALESAASSSASASAAAAKAAPKPIATKSK